MEALRIVVGFALAFASPAAAQELVTNGGFETGDFSGFAQTGNTDFTFVTNEPLAVASGEFGAAFGLVGSLGGITPTLATNEGQSYLISFDLQNLGSTPNFYE